MTSDPKTEAAVKWCYSTWGSSYYQDYYGADAPYPPVHTDMMHALLAESNVKTLLDAGCGPASMLRDFDQLGCDRFGFDLTPEMLAEAKLIMGKQGVPASHFWQGSVTDAASFRSPDSTVPDHFDAVICFGVFPHIPEHSEAVALSNLVGAAKPGGLVAIEARNQLFSMFTLNRYSREFFRNTLIREESLRELAAVDVEKLDQALSTLDQQFRMDEPPMRRGKVDEPGYDEVLSRTHVPFELKASAEQAGLTDVELLFYHFHALPPFLEGMVPGLFKRASIAMENPRDWRGYLMASAFVVVGRAPY